jgi:phosphoglycerate dehydrogenase-like enzyme
MAQHTVLVLAQPNEAPLALLEALPAETNIAVGDNLAAFERAAPDADIIFSWSIAGELLQQVWHMCPKVKWVHSRAAGLDGVIFPEIVDSPVPLTNGSGVFSQSLGEFFIGAVLYFAKDMRRMVRSQEAGIWDPFDIVEIAGQTVGIVGYGDIGRACAARARALNMRVLALRRSGPMLYNMDPLVDKTYGPDGLQEVLERSDYVLVAAPLTPETRGMISDAQFAAMKSSAVIINLGRGPVIDEAACVRALQERRIKGAALDVFDREPLPAGHPYYKLDNLLLSPHCADHTPDWLDQAMKFFIDQFGRFDSGEVLLNIVDKKLGY